MSKPTYSQYRSWGHGPFSAATLSIPIEVLLIVSVIMGIILGIVLW